MTVAAKLYQLISTLTEAELNSVLDFAEFLQQKHHITPPVQEFTVPSSTKKHSILELQGLLQTDQPAPTDQDIKAILAERLEQ